MQQLLAVHLFEFESGRQTLAIGDGISLNFALIIATVLPASCFFFQLLCIIELHHKHKHLTGGREASMLSCNGLNSLRKRTDSSPGVHGCCNVLWMPITAPAACR